MAQYVKGTSADKADIVDFGNYVFSQAHRPHDFKTLLPKGYADDRDICGCHYLARQDGKIRAMVAALPMRQTLAGCPLRFGLVGTVSVHPYARGEGHMKQLMQMMLDDQRAQGVDLLALGGQRQRYNYFGFEQAGVVINYSFSAASVRHAAKDVDASGISFAEIIREDDPLLDEAFALYSRQVVTDARPRADFLHIMHSWAARFYAVFKDQQFIGTLCAGGDTLNELLLTDEALLSAVIKAYMAANDMKSLRLDVAPYETRRIAYIDPLYDHCSLSGGEMLNVLNWRNVLSAYLSLKAQYQRLLPGSLRVEVDGQKLCIEVTAEGQPSVQTVDGTVDLTLAHLEAQRLFFGLNRLCTQTDERLRNWTPLPFTLNRADEF